MKILFRGTLLFLIKYNVSSNSVISHGALDEQYKITWTFFTILHLLNFDVANINVHSGT